MKRARKHASIQEYELLSMLKGETITDVQKNICSHRNHLIAHDISNWSMNQIQSRKFLPRAKIFYLKLKKTFLYFLSFLSLQWIGLYMNYFIHVKWILVCIFNWYVKYLNNTYCMKMVTKNDGICMKLRSHICDNVWDAVDCVLCIKY